MVGEERGVEGGQGGGQVGGPLMVAQEEAHQRLHLHLLSKVTQVKCQARSGEEQGGSWRLPTWSRLAAMISRSTVSP